MWYIVGREMVIVVFVFHALPLRFQGCRPTGQFRRWTGSNAFAKVLATNTPECPVAPPLRFSDTCATKAVLSGRCHGFPERHIRPCHADRPDMWGRSGGGVVHSTRLANEATLFETKMLKSHDNHESAYWCYSAIWHGSYRCLGYIPPERLGNQSLRGQG